MWCGVLTSVTQFVCTALRTYATTRTSRAQPVYQERLSGQEVRVPFYIIMLRVLIAECSVMDTVTLKFLSLFFAFDKSAVIQTSCLYVVIIILYYLTAESAHVPLPSDRASLTTAVILH